MKVEDVFYELNFKFCKLTSEQMADWDNGIYGIGWDAL